MNTVEVRCPNGPRKLFTKLKLGEEFATMIPEFNLIEFSCRDCSRAQSRQMSEQVRVFHRFNFIGELVATVIQQEPGSS